ncbi:MAG: DUF5777 family beta-barrel protein [Bacteroidota bacterium]
MQLKFTPLLLIVLLFTGFSSYAQDDLLNMITDSTSGDSPVLATFKSSRIINAHTVETVRKKDLDFRVGHRFGNIGGASGGGVHSLYGLDESADINIAFEYGLSDNFTIGISRSKVDEAIQGLLKYRILRQTENDRVPISVALVSSSVITPKVVFDKTFTNNDLHRLSYVYQAVIARKFNEGFSFEVIPTVIHRNWVPFGDENTNFALGAGTRIKLTKRTAIIADAFYTFSDFRKKNKGIYLMPPVSLGWEAETGGHVFTIMFSNARGLLENDYLVNTTDSWGKGGFKLSFIISRTFSTGRKK